MPDAVNDATDFALRQMQAWGSWSLVVLILIAVIVVLCLTIWVQRKDHKARIIALRSEIDAERDERHHWQSLAYQDKRDSLVSAQEQARETAASLQTVARVLDVLRGRQ